MTKQDKRHRRQWRFYETPSGNRPVREFLDGLPADIAAEIVAAMRQVSDQGLTAARHLRDDIWEVRTFVDKQAFRVLFAPEGHYKQVLLALEAFSKKTQRTPPKTIRLAERRLSNWRNRGKKK